MPTDLSSQWIQDLFPSSEAAYSLVSWGESSPGIPLLTARNLLDLKGVRHGFTTRQGGVSQGLFSSLNTAQKPGEDPSHITENKRRIVHRLGFCSSRCSLLMPQQRHTSLVKLFGPEELSPQNLNGRQEEAMVCDGMVTAEPGYVLGIVTADCVPLLLADGKAGVIGAVHAGWRGTIGGIVANTLQAMVACGASLSHIHAALGPCIWQNSYEVDQNFYDFVVSTPLGLASGDENSDFFRPSLTPHHWLFDLPRVIESQLAHWSVASITSSPYDTYSNPDLFFSCRRALHRGESSFGCSLSAIGLKS